MRNQLISIIAFTLVLCTGVWANPVSIDGGGKSGTDTSNVAGAEGAAAIGVKVKRLHLSAADLNPDLDKVARWDTLDIDMYHVDMAIFRDTLTYVLDRPGTGHRFVVPYAGRVTSGFGKRKLFGRKFHWGLDIDLDTGDQVVAVMNGKVRIARYSSGYGNFVVISHEGGLETLYGHMSELKVSEGQEIRAGDVIGLGGSTGQSTGSHLHFEFRVFGEQIDPLLVLDHETLRPVSGEVRIDASWFDHLLNMSDRPVHIVQEGETLEEICRMYEMEKSALLSINQLVPDEEIPQGTRLRLE